MQQEFVFDALPHPQCHASTIAETPTGLAAAWFGGTHEKHPDVGIWLARHDGLAWSAPEEVANGVETPGADGVRYPCWNPVLYQAPGGPLLLFYKAGPSPSTWWGMLVRSGDGGRTWSAPERLPEGILGPIKNKPIALSDGALLCPSSREERGWTSHVERTPDLGATWTSAGPMDGAGTFDVIQPTLLVHPGGRLQALLRSRQGVIAESWSPDEGCTWSPISATSLPNPNSGIDAVTLADGRHALVYNHVGMIEGKWGGPRTPLNLALSEDGQRWRMAQVLEDAPGEYSYPAIIQTADGRLHITYTHNRTRIAHVVVAPNTL